jgi:3'(2'), 5'-bisphosphate nucleotidase
MTLPQLSEYAIQAARLAAAAIMKVYTRPEGFTGQTKPDDSPVTEADLAANALIIKHLENTKLPIITEESEIADYSVRKNWTRYWLVDPLDGTKEFLAKNGDFTVNIALIENGKPVLGVVLLPVSSDLYTAYQGNGAWHTNGQGETKQLKVKNFALNESGLVVMASRSNLNEETKQFIQALNNPVLVNRGRSLKLLEVAAGNANLYPRRGTTMEWDIAAGQAILQEAGGKVTILSENEFKGLPLFYNKQNLENFHFLAQGNCLMD